MQKRIALFLSLAFLLAALSGCGGSSAAEQTADGGQKLSVVTTIFPEYDWVREIMGDQADGAEITLLLEYPADETEVTVTGEFELFEEDGFYYCQLKDAVLNT